MFDLLKWLFSTEDLYPWEEAIFVVANIALGACMFSLSVVMLIVGYKRRRDLSSRAPVLAFIVFCMLIGARGIARIPLFGSGYYRLITLMDVVTAVSGIVCMCFVPMIWRLGLKVRTPKEFEEVVKENKTLEFKAKVLAKVAEHKETITKDLVKEVSVKDAVIHSLTDSVAPIKEAMKEVTTKIDEKIEEVKGSNGH